MSSLGKQGRRLELSAKRKTGLGRSKHLARSRRLASTKLHRVGASWVARRHPLPVARPAVRARCAPPAEAGPVK